MTGTVVVREGRLSFSLENTQAVTKWDDSVAYREGVQKLQGTSAVDIAVLLDDHTVALVEVKDFRKYRIENKKRLSGGELALEIAANVRDTLSGLVWAVKRKHADTNVERIVQRLFQKNTPPVQVVFWLEEDGVANPVQADALRSAIQAALHPIHAKVIVTSSALEALTKHPLAWLHT